MKWVETGTSPVQICQATVTLALSKGRSGTSAGASEGLPCMWPTLAAAGAIYFEDFVRAM